MTSASAADLAQSIAASLRVQEQAVARLPAGEAIYAEALIARHIAAAENRPAPATLPPAPQRAAAAREIEYIAQDAAIRRLWQAHRIVYDYDPDLWAQLAETENDTLVPAGLMRHLPHPDPFIAFPNPLVLPLGDGLLQRVVGCFVTGRSGRSTGAGWVGAQTSTHAEDATGALGLLIVGLTETPAGKPVMAYAGVRDMVFQRVTLDTGGEVGVTVGQLINQTMARFDIAPYRAGDVANDLPVMIRRAMSALVYLCATNAELRPLPARPAAKRKPGEKAPKPAKVIRVGYEIGAALRAWYKSESTPDASAGGRKPVRPHMRRSHFHTFWAGPQRTEKRVKWLPPIPVNTTGKPADKITVVPVRSQP